MNSKRITEIDGLRGVSALAVMLFHYTFVFNQNWKVGNIFHYGYMGVPMFFIISGFVIYMSLESNKTPFGFVYSRFLRLFPIYWISLIITVAAMFLMGIHLEILTWQNITINFTMLQRFIGFKDIDGAYWTLAVELMFYLFVIIILFFNKLEKIIEIFLAIIFLLLIIRSTLAIQFTEIVSLKKIMDQLRYFHLFLAGMIFYNIYKNGISRYYFLLLCICIGLNFQAQIRFNIFVETFIILFFFLVFYILTTKFKYFLFFFNNPILQFLGKISYPLYLLNEMFGVSVFKFLNLYFDLPLSVEILIVSSLVIFVSSLIHLFIEKPIFALIKSKHQNDKPANIFLK